MSLPLYDAHNHLHDPRLAPHRAGIDADLAAIGLRAAVVNGTRESDWAAVAELARERPDVIPSFGLHPWYIRDRSPDWLARLAQHLDAASPPTAVGEIGLDRWLPEHDLADQQVVFGAQLALAAARNLPVTIHCLQAWGALIDVLRDASLPERGFLVHAYGGPAEMVVPLAKRGAYFSFNPSFLHARKEARREIFRTIPAERLLVETDAPDMAPPAEATAYHLPPDASGGSLNHPATLADAYVALAKLRGVEPGMLAGRVEENFHRLFGAN